jgi:hypothetical protein
MAWLALRAAPSAGPATDEAASAAARPAVPGEPVRDDEVTRLMRRVEERFRAGWRGVRLRIRTARDDDEPVVGRPDAVEIWGVQAGDHERTEMLFVFTRPRWMRGTGLMLVDPWGAALEDDEIWYHMPSFNRFKSVSQSSLKVLVAGTCLTYEDAHGFLSTDKYDFAWARADMETSGEKLVLARPKTSELAENLGYLGLAVTVDTRLVMVRRIEYTGLSGELVKTYETDRPVQIGEAWLPGSARAQDLRSLVVSEVDFAYWPLAEPPPSTLYDQEVDRPLIDRFFAHLASQGIAPELEEEGSEEPDTNSRRRG